MSQVDQKRAFNKLKHELEPYRSLVVKLNSVLTWQKNVYPGIIFGAVSSVFLLLWALDLSFITLASLGLLIIMISEYLIPTISRFIGNSDNWNGDQEAEFENICTTICSIKNSFTMWNDFLFKEIKSTMFTIIASAVLLVLAWLGATINNLLLMYIVTLGIVMWPGIQDKQIFKAFSEQCSSLIQSKIKAVNNKKKGD